MATHSSRSSPGAPSLPAARGQNEVVTRAAAAAAGSYAAGGYDTVYDGVVGPWFLPGFAATVDLALSPLAGAGPAAAGLLRLLVFRAPEPVPLPQLLATPKGSAQLAAGVRAGIGPLLGDPVAGALATGKVVQASSRAAAGEAAEAQAAHAGVNAATAKIPATLRRLLLAIICPPMRTLSPLSRPVTELGLLTGRDSDKGVNRTDTGLLGRYQACPSEAGGAPSALYTLIPT